MSEDRELEEIKRRLLSQIQARQQKPSILQPGIVNVLTDLNFDQALSISQPLLVDFWADWCMPCKMMSPVVESLAQDFKDRAYFGKLNVDENQRTATRYGVMSIPNFILYKKGRIVDQVIGAVGSNLLEASISRQLD